MNIAELKLKVLKNEICILCLNHKSDELIHPNDDVGESDLKPYELIEKFHIVELSRKVKLNIICGPCIITLQTFYEFHLTATSSQSKIIEALSNVEEQTTSNEEVLIEFLNVENELGSVDEDESRYRESSLENCFNNEKLEDEESFLECNFSSKTYKRKTHLERHITQNHQDGTVKEAKNLKRAETCDLCGAKFLQRQDYEDHVKALKCVDSPECRFCKEEFSDIPQLKEHLRYDHPKGRKHICPICFKSFRTVSNRNSHLQSHNAENSVTCSECNQGFKSVLYLRKHQKAIHTKVENTCEICDRKFDTQQKFDYHLKTHESVKRYKCTHDGCDKTFMQYHHLENHKTTHTGVSKYLCFKYGREFKQDCNLKTHLKIHDSDNKKIFKCSFHNCEKAFKLSSSLRCHKKTHEMNSNISQCPECGKKFSQRSSLRAHFQNHFRDPDNRPFKCNQPGCNRSFFQERSIKYHKSTAHGIGEPILRKDLRSTYVCDFCKKSFKLQSLLKRHILIHVEEEQKSRKHKCDKCEASFKRPEHLKLHINSVHFKFKPHKCEHPDCGKSFAQIGDRNVHMKVHTDEKPHICSICQKAFRLAKGLRAHVKTHQHVEKEKEQIADISVNTSDQKMEQNEAEIIYETLQPSTQIVFVLTPIQQ